MKVNTVYHSITLSGCIIGSLKIIVDGLCRSNACIFRIKTVGGRRAGSTLWIILLNGCRAHDRICYIGVGYIQKYVLTFNF